MSLHRFIVLAASAAAFVPFSLAQASTPTTPLIAAPNAASGARAPRPIKRVEFLREIDATYKKLDANSDGNVTQAEIAAAQARSGQAVDALLVKRREEGFRRLDTNRDGQLSLAEYNAGSPLPQRQRPAPAVVLKRMDANKDQKVSLVEYRTAPLATFDKMDLNRDGTISLDEQTKARQAAR